MPILVWEIVNIRSLSDRKAVGKKLKKTRNEMKLNGYELMTIF